MTLPLQDLKIIDLSRVLAGPFATQILADLGAEVIKIESPAGDDTRKWGPPFIGDDAVYFHSTNRNKKSVVCDFKNKEDLENLDKLIANSDILIENFKVGALKRWGLDYDSLQKKHPKLIYCSITGFGQKGPLAHLAGYDALIQAMGGLMSLTGADKEHPTKVGVAMTDIMTGLYAVIGILAMVHERRTSNQGQQVDISLLDCQISSLSHRAMNYLVTGKVPQPMGNAHPNIVPYQSFKTKDSHIFVAIGNDFQFQKFSDACSEKWYDDEKFTTNPSRVKNRLELIPMIEKVLSKESAEYWLEKFDPSFIPSGPINDLQGLSENPQVKAKDIFTKMDQSDVPCIRSPLNFSRTPIEKYSAPPKLGEHQGNTFLK